MTDVALSFRPREYQKPLLTALRDGVRRACIVWHRRAGKEMTCFNWMVLQAIERPGTYYYFFPTYKQGQKILWLGMDKSGKRFTSYIPPILVKSKNETDMRIELINGSIIQVIGADNIDNIVGTNIMGCVFSEYSLQNPIAWEYMRPILRESGGWAIFNFTPRGMNHAKILYDNAVRRMKTDGAWFAQLLTVDHTNALRPEDIEEERRDGMPEEMIEQEYYCSFTANLHGAYFGRLLDQARNEGRICDVPYDPLLPVHTAWDLGVHDPTAIWTFQVSGPRIYVIDYYEQRGVGLEQHVKYVREHEYTLGVPLFGEHIAPHDIEVKEWGVGRTRRELAERLGIDFMVSARLAKDEQIEAAKTIIPRCVFDQTRCANGVAVLENYVAKYDEVNRVYGTKPDRNWAVHGADAFQLIGVNIENIRNDYWTSGQFEERQERALTTFDVGGTFERPLESYDYGSPLPWAETTTYT